MKKKEKDERRREEKRRGDDDDVVDVGRYRPQLATIVWPAKLCAAIEARHHNAGRLSRAPGNSVARHQWLQICPQVSALGTAPQLPLQCLDFYLAPVMRDDEPFLLSHQLPALFFRSSWATDRRLLRSCSMLAGAVSKFASEETMV